MYDSSEKKRIASSPTKLGKLKQVHIKISLCSHARTPLKGGKREIGGGGGWGQREREREVYVFEKLLYCTAMQMAEGERIEYSKRKSASFDHRHTAKIPLPITEDASLPPHPSQKALSSSLTPHMKPI